MLERRPRQQLAVPGQIEVAWAVDLSVGGEGPGAEAPALKRRGGTGVAHGDLVRPIAEQLGEIDVEAMAAVALGGWLGPIGGDGGDQLPASEDLDAQAPLRLGGRPGPAVDLGRPFESHLALDFRPRLRSRQRLGEGGQLQDGEQAPVEGHRPSVERPGLALRPDVEEAHAAVEVGLGYRDGEVGAAVGARLRARPAEGLFAVGGGFQPGGLAGHDPAGDRPFNDAGQPSFDHALDPPAPLQARLGARWPLIEGPLQRSKPPGRPRP